MRVILDIDENVLKEMQMHADIIEEDLNIMLSNKFKRMVIEPGEVISEEVHKNDCKDLEVFYAKLYKLLSDLSYSHHNLALQKVLLRIRDEHLQNAFVVTDLFKTYKDA